MCVFIYIHSVSPLYSTRLGAMPRSSDDLQQIGAFLDAKATAAETKSEKQHKQLRQDLEVLLGAKMDDHAAAVETKQVSIEAKLAELTTDQDAMKAKFAEFGDGQVAMNNAVGDLQGRVGDMRSACDASAAFSADLGGSGAKGSADAEPESPSKRMRGWLHPKPRNALDDEDEDLFGSEKEK